MNLNNRAKKQTGFTFIELLVAVGVISLLAVSGVNIFLASLRGTSQVEQRKALDDRARLILDSMGKFLKEGRVVSLDGQPRSSCIQVGNITGNTLIVKALDDLNTTFSISSGMISSVSSVTVVINPETVTLDRQSGLSYYFSWFCSSGVPDRLQMLFKATSTGTSGESGLSNNYSLDVIMRNSGQ